MACWRTLQVSVLAFTFVSVVTCNTHAVEDDDVVPETSIEEMPLTVQLPSWYVRGGRWGDEHNSTGDVRAALEGRMRAFGQDKEDKHAYQHYFYGKHSGTFLEMGALNGRTFSNSLLFEKLGWRGVLIEPTPHQYEKLVKFRPLSVCINAAVCAASRLLHFLGAGPTAGILEFMDNEHLRKYHLQKGTDVSQAVPIACLPLSTILRRFGVQHIDFWSLDVENAELEVLQTFDFQQVTIDVLVVEALGHNTTAEGAIRELLAKHGYRLDAHVERNDWFVREGFKPAVAPEVAAEERRLRSRY